MGDGKMDQNKIWESFNLKTDKQNPRYLAVNTVLAGKYLVGPVLGEGGFGITYAGYDLNMETRIAIKEYFPVELVTRDTTLQNTGGGGAASGSSASDGGESSAGSISASGGGSDRVISLSGEKRKTYQQGLKKYVDEARNVSRFAGIPGIVSVKDFFYENDTAYIVMEYIEGISLKEYIRKKGGKVLEEEALAILRPVLEALEKVHAAGIVHRDISPDNIMLTFAEKEKAEQASASDTTSTPSAAAVYGDISAVKLIDFGAARMTSKNDQKSLTIILKHGYAPEEQYRSHGEQGPWTDVYALCAVLYRMLTGKVPEPAMDRLFSDGLKSPEELGVKVSPAVSEAVMKGLAVKKEDRIQTVRELMDMLYAGKRIKRGRAKGVGKICLLAGAAALAAVVVLLLVVAGNTMLTKRQRSDSDVEAVGQPAMETGGTAVQEDEAADAGKTAESGETSDAGADTDSAEGEIITFQEEEELGEQIAFPSPQTSISGVQQAHTLFLLPDGTVKALGGNAYGQCMVQDWEHMAAVSAGARHSLGLRTDGKVYAAGANEYGQCETGSWSGMVAVAAGNSASFGLRADGTVEACGMVENLMDEISAWTDIRTITAVEGKNALIGLDGSGTVHFAGFGEEMPSITDWADVRYIGYGRLQGTHLVGLCEDGSVRRVPLGAYADDTFIVQYAGMENWTDMQQISFNTPALGVKTDGMPLFLDSADPQLQEELRTWTDLEAITSAYIWDRLLVFGLHRDGTILEFRQNNGNAEFSDMKNLKWVQPIPGMEDGLSAVTGDGRLLTYGLEIVFPFYERNMQRLGIAPQDLAGFVGDEGYLCEDGTLYGVDDTLVEGWEEAVWSESDVCQAVELWNAAYSGIREKAYAILLDNGQVKLRQAGEPLEGTGIPPEEYMGQAREIEEWTDVVQLLGVDGTVYGLHSDGTVSTTVEENQEKLEGITGVKKIAGYIGSTSQTALTDVLGLMEDGTVLPLISNDYSVIFGRTQTESWSDVSDIAVGESHVAGLLSDGTVIAAGSNHAGQCDVEDWENIVFLTAGRNCTLGITADGGLKMAGSLY